MSAVALEIKAMMRDVAIVYVVDDDISVRESIESLVSTEGLRVRSFSSAEDFLLHERARVPGCLVLDVGLPSLNGLELQQKIGANQVGLPIIFITGRGDIPTSVRAIKAGAVEFLTKPFGTDELLTAISGAIERSRQDLDKDADLQVIRTRFESLSRREREVMELVVRGRLNKQVAATLEISEITVKAHRGHMMRKMKARSLANLVNMAAQLGLPAAR